MKQLCGVIVDCDINNGLALNIESYIFGGQLKNTIIDYGRTFSLGWYKT